MNALVVRHLQNTHNEHDELPGTQCSLDRD
jgi:hypothetical protein